MIFINSSNKEKQPRNIQIAKTHEKKFLNLNHHKAVVVITDLSLYKISEREGKIVKYGLGNSIPPKKLNSTDEFVNSDLIHRYLTEKLKSKNDQSSFRSDLSHLANSYYSNYKPARATSKKHKTFMKFRNNKDI